MGTFAPGPEATLEQEVTHDRKLPRTGCYQDRKLPVAGNEVAFINRPGIPYCTIRPFSTSP